MRQRIIRMCSYAVLSIAVLAGCTPMPGVARHATIIDWVPFIQFHGISYIAVQTGAADTLIQADDLGPQFAEVQFMVADNVQDPAYRVKDGDAAFLPAGTPVFRVTGYDPQFRLAATQDGQLMLFEADTNPHAQRGAELLDIGGHVLYIGINSETDGTTELAAITDAQQVTTLVEMVLTAPVDQRPQNHDDQAERYFVAFHLRDATVVNRAFWPDSGELSRGILLPSAFSDAVRHAVQHQP